MTSFLSTLLHHRNVRYRAVYTNQFLILGVVSSSSGAHTHIVFITRKGILCTFSMLRTRCNYLGTYQRRNHSTTVTHWYKRYLSRRGAAINRYTDETRKGLIHFLARCVVGYLERPKLKGERGSKPICFLHFLLSFFSLNKHGNMAPS